MKRRSTKLTNAEQNQKTVELYKKDGQPWPATSRQIAVWAINNDRWQQPLGARVSACAGEIAEAMRQEYIVDSRGNHVRSKICASLKLKGEAKQAVLWNDIKDVARNFLVRSLQDRRKQVVGECRQMQL